MQVASRYLELGRTKDALEACHTALAADPRHVGAWCVKAHCHLILDQVSDAYGAIVQALELKPDSAMALRLSAEYQLRIGARAGALTTARRAVEVAPNEVLNLTHLAGICSKLGLEEGATKAAREAVRLAPNDPATHESAGLVALRFHDMRAARASFTRARQLDPSSWTAHNNLGVVCSQRASDVGALFHFGRSVSLNPQQLPVSNLERTALLAQVQVYSVVLLALTIVAVVAEQHRHVQLWPVGLLLALAVVAVVLVRSLPRQIRRALSRTAIVAIGRSSLPGLFLQPLRNRAPWRWAQLTLESISALVTVAFAVMLVVAMVDPVRVSLGAIGLALVAAVYQVLLMAIWMAKRREAPPSPK
ncbi:MAG: tetratricopeptide repeat protein [Actinobacteria bacterium]|nr:tetratricopeptide repeat protein [Actinomycetota bacterium]